jgi:HD-like signal output (HDOD) protein
MDLIAQAGKVRRLEPGSTLFLEGTNDDTLFYLMEGEIEIRKRFFDQERTVSFLAPDQWIGEIAFLKRIPRQTSAHCTLPSKVIVLDRTSFEGLGQQVRQQILIQLSELFDERITHLLSIQEKLVDQRARLIYTLKSAAKTENAPGSLIQSLVNEMPRLPAYAGNLVTILNSGDTPFDRIAASIRQDPSLAAQVLKHVNSPFYGFEQPIVDLQHAITMLGMNQIYLLLLYNAIQGTMPNTRPFINLQRSSVLMSFLSMAVADRSSRELVPLAGTMGLLHDIGRSVVLLVGESRPEMGEMAGLLDHYKVGGQLLMRWNLPEKIIEVVRLQSSAFYVPPSELPQEFRKGVALLAVARMVASDLTGRGQGEYLYRERYIAEAGFGEQTVEEIARDHVLPWIEGRRSSLPQVVRNLLHREK